ncbi:hybrid sensor histidine kinase/response regulator transcription factor [Telluribacter sp.]|jgi:signal transduction histidine kinase/ligand-binding sensor domain-containing protein/DNA-binding response OmpR family regulator|uniref:hybrid sensor histidine kinase/response regulator transcription factor n=1 Tax=Telluribacter sp. TaxID=1978767 RepID=UPI002E0D3187|nr:two-component regulator propeller domain-containing protein [Telluribacter sp.]
MRLLFLFLGICCLWILPLYLQAQKVGFEQLTINDGLSHNSISCLLEDHKGYLWFGTQDGLNKYDGYTFTTYQLTPHDTASIPQNEIMALWEDKQGQLWIGTPEGGVCKFDPRTETFTRYAVTSTGSFVPKLRAVSAINQDATGMMWIGNWAGELRQFNPRTEQYSPPIDLGYRQQEGAIGVAAIHDAIGCIYQDRQGTLWIGNSTGLHQLVKGKPGIHFKRYVHQPAQPGRMNNNIVSSIFEDSAGVLWVGTDQGLSRFDRRSGKFTTIPNDSTLPSNGNFTSQNSIAEDKAGNLWIGTFNGGLRKLDPQRTHFTRYLHQPADPTSLSSNQIVGLLVDRSGILWIGTYGSGVQKLDATPKPFLLYQRNPFDASSLSHNDITALCEDKQGNIWVGTQEGGLNRFDKHSGTFTRFQHDPSDPNSLPGNSVSALFEDTRGTLWVATQQGYSNGKLSVLNPKTGTFRPFVASRTGLPELGGDRIFTFYEDRDGLLWLGTTNGIKSLDQRTGTIMHYRHDPGNPNGLSDYPAIALLEDRLGNLWIGSRSVALTRFNERTGTFTHYKPIPGDTTSIPSVIVQCIYEDSRGNLWFGTKAGGLSRFDHQKQTFTTYTQRDGLPSNSVYSILEDDLGNLWLGTNKGLARFNVATRTFTAFDAQDGLQSNQLIGSQPVAAYLKARDGRLYFGGINGLNAFDPAQLPLNRYIPPVVITQFRVFDQPLPGIQEDTVIELAHSQNFFSIQFAALNYRNPQKNQYAYRLDGVDPDWVYSGTRHLASYTDIGPGTYTFRVKAANNDGVWNDKGTSLTLIIHPPFWRTWWAYTCYGLAFIILLVGYIRFRLQRERERQTLERQQWEAEQLKAVDELKSRFFANITHELRTPLSLILSPAEQLLREVTEPRHQQRLSLIGRHARQLLQLINQLLDLSKLEAGSMSTSASRGNVAEFTGQLVDSFRYSAEEKGITLHYDARLGQQEWLFDADKWGKIVGNLVSNALKFTPAGGTVSVALDMRQSQPQDSPVQKEVQLTVADTGIGMAADQVPYIFDRFYQADASSTRAFEGTGVGLSLVRELVTLLSGQINVESKLGSGTRFRVSLPMEEAIPGDTDATTPLPISTSLPETHEGQVPDSGKVHPGLTADPEAPLVLVVEDHAELRAFIANELSASYRVLTAANGKEGWERVQQELPEVVISDVMMPEMDGFTLTELIKTTPATNHIAVVLLTAKAAQESKLAGLVQGADEYLTKPFHPQELHLRLRNIVSHQQKLRQYYRQHLAGASANANPEPAPVEATPQDTFLLALYSAIEAQLDNTQFDVDQLAQAVTISRRTLYRKLSTLTGLTPNEVIRQYRLRRATELLKAGQPIAQVAYQVGFESPSYFSQSFKESYQMTPSEYLQKQVAQS